MSMEVQKITEQADASDDINVSACSTYLSACAANVDYGDNVKFPGRSFGQF